MPAAAKNDAEFAARFWARVDRSGTCWLWRGTLTTAGYGSLKRDQRVLYAHRTAWEIARGAIPDGLYVLHRCDNRRCVNPEHLFLGTQRDNLRDCTEKFRGNGRPGSTTAKLTDEQVREIRGRYTSEHISQDHLARDFGVSQMTISKIVRGETWRRLLATERRERPRDSGSPRSVDRN